jgi:DNA-binding NarL/FixJ family response regulator
VAVIRILIVDDNELVRKHLKNFLQGADGTFNVCGEAGDGVQAVLKAHELKPDAVILDLAMPLMDGISAAREIAKETPAMAMFLYTLHMSPQVEVEALSAGIRKVVAKPSASDLVPLLRNLGKAQGPQETVSSPVKDPSTPTH